MSLIILRSFLVNFGKRERPAGWTILVFSLLALRSLYYIVTAFQVPFFRTYLLITQQLNAENEITCKQCLRLSLHEQQLFFQFSISNVFLICAIEDLCIAGCILPMTIFGLSLADVHSRQSVFWTVVENAALAINLPCKDWWSGGLDFLPLVMLNRALEKLPPNISSVCFCFCHYHERELFRVS